MQTRQYFFSQLVTKAKKIRFDDALILIIGIILALLLRLSFHDYYTRDYSMFTRCYLTIHDLGFAAFKTGCTNYAPFYEYILYLETVIFPGMTNTAGTKLPSIAFDFLCAWFVYLTVRIKYPTGLKAAFAALAMLFAPTVILNSSGWAQFDVIYATFLIACVYFLLKEKGWLACLAFGLAISVKFQAVVMAPLLVALFLKNKISWKALLLVPAVYIATIIPSLIAGRPLMELLTIYVGQVDLFKVLSINTPNVYSWIPEGFYDQFYLPGLLFCVSVCFIYFVLVYKSKTPLTSPLIIQLALASSLLVPYFLPKMHERYFFPVDILSIVFAFFFPEYFFVPIVLQLVSFFSYQPYLFEQISFPLPGLALVVLTIIVIVMRQLILKLYPAINGDE